MNEIRKYNVKNTRLPNMDRWLRLLFKLYALPFTNKISYLRRTICKKLSIPDTTQFNSRFYCIAGNLKIGSNVSLADTFMLDYALITIGNNVSFSYKNTLITSAHDIYDFNVVVVKPITIGNDVWITTGVTILPGVTIGSGVVIGAGSVVTKDIPPGVFAAGNPCVPLKQIEFKINS